MAKQDSKFIDLYNKHSKELFRFCMFKLNNKENSEDIVADAYIELYKQDFENLENVRAWLFKVCRNLIYDKYIRKSYKNDAKYSDIDLIEESLKDSDNLEIKALDEQSLELIKQEIRTLGELNAEIIILRVWEELSFSEIAELMNLKEMTVKQRFYRGVEELKSKIENKDKKKRMHSFTLPIIFMGLTQLKTLKEFNLSSNLLTNILNITGITMTAKTGIGAVLSTTGAKIALTVVGAAALAGLGVLGIVSVINNQKPTPVAQQPEEKPEVVKPACKIQTYSNKTFPNFTFDYDSCKWVLSQKTENNTNSKDFYAKSNVHSITLISKSSVLTFRINMPISNYGFGGPSDCYQADYSKITNTIVQIKNEGQFNPLIKDNYIYTSQALLPGTKSYDEALKIFRLTNPNTQVNMCLLASPAFITNYKSNNNTIKEDGFLYIYSNTTETNEVIKTLKWKKEDPYAGWKTYSNQYYSIKYPANWFMETVQSTVTGFQPYLKLKPSKDSVALLQIPESVSIGFGNDKVKENKSQIKIGNKNVKFTEYLTTDCDESDGLCGPVTSIDMSKLTHIVLTSESFGKFTNTINASFTITYIANKGKFINYSEYLKTKEIMFKILSSMVLK